MTGLWPKKGKAVAIACAVAALSFLIWALFCGRRTDEPPEVSRVKTERLRTEETRSKGAKATAAPLRRQRPVVFPSTDRKCGGTNENEIMRIKAKSLPKGPRPAPDPEQPLSIEGQKLCRKISAGYEADDFASVKALVPAARASKEKAVREEMVWALDWFGEKALPEIVSFLSDPDEEIAQDAFGAWESALEGIEDENQRLYVVEYVLRTGAPKDMLESVAQEYVGMNDRAAVESLARIIDGAAPGAEQARERYESITGEPYTTSEAARKWVEEFADE